jgi:hypothetical protein
MAGRVRPGRRGAAAAALVLLVSALHLWLAGGVLEARIGDGAADTRPRRIEVAFVRVLTPSAPAPVIVAVNRPRAAPRAALAPLAAASAPEVEPPAVEPEPAEPPVPPTLPAPPDPVLAQAPAVEIPAATPPSPPASAAEAQTFEWPPSTRMTYTLTGNYRGPIEGQAQVEWLRSGSRYQVRLELSVGPFFAPLMRRSLTSDGELTERGLQPQRYDEVTKVAFSDPRRLGIVFDGQQIQLPGGKSVPQPVGVQDTASQFVQLTWMFTTQPQLLERGTTIALPLALPRYVDTWVYEVLERESLYTPFGPVETVHVKPRREPRPGIDLTAELWVAPSLQYLPVRILIRQDAQTWIDLLVNQLPLQAAPAK